MGVADHVYDKAMVESALFRSGGVTLESYAYGPATNPDPAAGFRKYGASGKGVGHVYVHVEGSGDDVSGHGPGLAKKSRYADHETMVSVIVEIMKHANVVAALRRLDANPGTQEWLHGDSAVPVTGAWYGFAQNEATKRKITKVSINLRSHGDALFISSSYPEAFQVSPVQ
jgi:hypothetical protein